MKSQRTLWHRMGAKWGWTFCSVFVLLLMISMVPWKGPKGDVTRASVIYIGNIYGEGDDNDIVLAGHRWYQCDFTFIEWIGDVERSVVSMELGDDTIDLFQYIPAQDNLTMLEGSGLIDVKDPLIVLQHGENLTITFKIFVHLNWTADRPDQVTLVPELWTNGSSLEVDSPNLLRFEVFGRLEPIGNRIEVFDSLGREITTGKSVLSSSTVSVSGITFQYKDSQGRFAGLGPVPDELDPKIVFGTSIFNSTLKSGGFVSDVILPDSESGEVEFGMVLPGIRDDWLFDVDNWAFSVELDGTGPKIELIKPSLTKKEPYPEFNWNISIKDRPINSDVEVNGTNIQYRVWTSTSGWSAWKDAEDVGSGRSIYVTGSAAGDPGPNNTILQFKAYDELGNLNISGHFVIGINSAPIIDIPSEIEGLVLMDNTSLELEGSEFVSDLDDDILQFKWYLDDSEALSTLSEFKKPLFNVEPGQHTVRLVVSDGVQTVEASFEINVTKAPVEKDDRNWLQKFQDDENFVIYTASAVGVLLFLIIVVFIIVISNRVRERRRDDFIIDGDRSMDRAQAEETAKRILDSMSYSAEAQFEVGAEAEVDTNGFDFDYNLYEIVGVESNAPEAEIKKKYRKLAAYFHPDRVQMHGEISDEEAREEMVKVNKVKEILLDPEQRAKYDIYITENDFSMDFDDIVEEVEEKEEEWG